LILIKKHMFGDKRRSALLQTHNNGTVPQTQAVQFLQSMQMQSVPQSRPSLPWPTPTTIKLSERDQVLKKHQQAKVVERLQAKYSLSATKKAPPTQR